MSAAKRWWIAMLLAALCAPALALPPAGGQPLCDERMTGDADLAACATSGRDGATAARAILLDLDRFGSMTLTATTRFVEITGNGTPGAAAGIHLTNVRNVVIRGADLEFNDDCVRIQDSVNVAIRDSVVRACKRGISASNVTGLSVNDSRVSVSDEDVRLDRTPLASFHNDNLSVASGQIGFSFQDEPSYNTTIDESNVVNFAPVQWYAGLANTVLSDKEVHVKGMTNVGQIVCYACSNVTIERPRAASGVGAGVLFVASSNVSVVDALVEGNAGAGVELRRVNDGTIVDARANSNGAGAWLNATNRASVARGVFVANSAEGIRITLSGNASVADATLQGNTDGIVVDRSNLTRVDNVTSTSNTNDGLRATGASGSCASRFVGDCILVTNSAFDKNGANGIELSGLTRANVTANAARANGKAGAFVATGTTQSRIVGNEFASNQLAGAWLSSAGPLVRVMANELADQPAQARLTASPNNAFDANNATLGPGDTGFVFDDETSYENDISATNLVNGTPVRWLVALVGSSLAPQRIANVTVTQQNLTNVAQFMVYKSSYVDVSDVHAANGTRGILLLRSSSINVSSSSATDSATGIELRGAQTVGLRDVRTERDGVGVRVLDTINATISDVIANGSTTGVSFDDTRSRGAIVQRVDASGVAKASVQDASFSLGPPPRSAHRIVDAGLDHYAGPGQNVTFNDAIGTARFGSERIVRQTWDFGDGNTTTSTEDALLRPTHAYDSVGEYVATYTVETANGAPLSDPVRVRVLGPPSAPHGLVANVTGRSVALQWIAPDATLPILSYHVHRGGDADNLTPYKTLATDATTFTDPNALEDGWYAVSAVTLAGEGPQSAPTHVVLPPKPTTPASSTPKTTTPEGKGAPAPAWAPLAALALAAALVARGGRRRAASRKRGSR